MSWGGNLIARSLALVAVATGVAFVDWSARPLTLALKSPKALAASEGAMPPTEPVHSDRPGDEAQQDAPPAAEQSARDGETGDPAGRGSDAADPPPFDPAQLDTEIGTVEAYQLWLTGAVAFIDARPAKDYEAGHIPFAYLVPAESIGAGRLGEMMEKGGVDPSWRVVVYCEGGSCDASHLVALTLQDMGFEKIHIDVDGFPGWEAAGHEVETGPDQILGDVQ